jgi:hypothetical protein
MKKVLVSNLFTIPLSILVTIITINWAMTGDPLKLFLTPQSLSSNVAGIERVDVEFSNRKIFLSVHLDKPLTCNQVIKALGINQFVIKSRKYVPNCSIVNNELVKITYNEVVET